MANKKSKIPMSAQSETNTEMPNPEVSDKPTRRKFSPKKKLKILEELDACTRKGEVGAVMRKYGQIRDVRANKGRGK